MKTLRWIWALPGAQTMKNKSFLKVCAGITLIGLATPMIGWVIAGLRYGFKRVLTIELFIALACNVIPYAVFMLIARLALLDAIKRNHSVSFPNLLGVIGAGTIITCLDLLGHYLAWRDIDSPGHRGDSMEALAFFFFSIYLMIGMLILYKCGRLGGKWYEREMS